MRAALLVVALALVGADDKADTKQFKKLQGTWELVSGEMDGKAIAVEHVKKGKIKNDGASSTLETPHQSSRTVKATLKRFDEARKPAELDFLRLEGPNKGTLMLAIIEFDGPDKYRICFDPSGKGRPTAFSTREGSGHLLHVWKRVKE